MSKRITQSALLVAAVAAFGQAPSAMAQRVFDIQGALIAFDGDTAERQAGSGNISGSDNPAGTAFCYPDVITVDSTNLDALVTLKSRSNVSVDAFDYKGSRPAGSDDQLKLNVTWDNTTNPREVVMGFVFTEGGAGTASCAGAPVILRNVFINSYDLDSSGDSPVGQGTSFTGIGGYTLGNPTEMLVSTVGSAPVTTTFIPDPSNGNVNNGAAPNTEDGDKWRVQVSYDEIPTSGIDITLSEKEGSGTAYYALDFAERDFFNPSVYDLLLANVGDDADSSNNKELTSETGTSDCFDVVLGAQPTADVSIAISGLDASEGSLDTNSLTFTNANWDTVQQVCITGVDDALFDGDIDYTLTLTATSADAAFNGRTALVPVTNVDNEGGVGFSVNDVSVNEAAGNLTFTVTRSGSTSGEVTVDYSLASGTATLGTDFTAVTGTLSFADGVSSATISVPITQDAIFERSENFTVTLANPSTGSITDDTGVGTILDDGSGAGGTDNDSPSFSINDVSGFESDGSLTFTVTKTGQTGFNASVSFSMANGTAVGTSVQSNLGSFDYLQSGGTLTFLPSETQKTITVQITSDGQPEGPETFRVILSSPVDAQVSDGEGVGTINDPQVASLSLAKSVFETGASGMNCASATDELIYVNSSRDPVDLTWCFTITNTGTTTLENPSVSDAALGITLTSPTSGSLPLQPGASLIFEYDETGRTASLLNTASVSMDSSQGPVTGQGSATFAYVFDPPFGVKVGTMAGADRIRWTMVWINDAPINANGVVIEDTIAANMQYVPGTLTCTARGSTTVVGGSCSDTSNFTAPNLLSIEADFGPDQGATDEASAANELVISFEATIVDTSSSQTFENQATATWDADGPGGAAPLTGVTDSDNATAGAQPSVVSFRVSTPVPVMPWQWLLLMVTLAGWMGLRARPRA